MRAILQRVSDCEVIVDAQSVAKSGLGLLVLLGVEDADTAEDAQWLARKIAQMRIFEDTAGAMNTSVMDEDGDVVVVSQFTLHAATKKGNRPSFIKAARPEVAEPLYRRFVEQLEQHLGKQVQTGIFGAMMQVQLTNQGPVTIFIDTKNKE